MKPDEIIRQLRGELLESKAQFAELQRTAVKTLAHLNKAAAQRGELRGCVAELLLVIDDFMPNIGNCALQNYKRLNEAPIRARKALEDQ